VRQITAGRKKYALYSFTGRVTGMGKDFIMFTFVQTAKTKLPGNKEWQPPVRVESTTTAFNHVFLKAVTGEEHSLRLDEFNIACREGHEMTAVWIIREGEERGPHIAIHNRTTLQTFFAPKEVKKLYDLPLSVQLLSLAAAFCTGYTLYGHITGVAAVIVARLLLYFIKRTQIQRFKHFFNRGMRDRDMV
jgi:hypothetical protein